MNQVSADYQFLKQNGVNCLRISYIEWNYPASEQIALLAKQDGFRVIIGGTFAGTPYGNVTPQNLSTYTSQVLQEAAWAQANQIDQLSLGNEAEYNLSGLTEPQWIAYLHGLSDQVHKVYAGVVSYETSSDFLNQWILGGRGSIDLLGWNSYCGGSCNAQRVQVAIAAFGVSHNFISEWNSSCGVITNCNDLNAWAQDLTSELSLLQPLNVPIYYFSYRYSTDDSSSPWSVQTTAGLRMPVAQALGL